MAAALTVLQSPLFWALLGLQALLLLGLARLRGLRWWPAWVLRLLLAGLVLTGILAPRGEPVQRETPQRQVLVVDQSDSISVQARQQIQEQARQWQAAGENRLLVAFGDHPEALLKAGDPWPNLDGRASDLPAALNLAGDLLGTSPGKVILASDGETADPTAVDAAVAQLAEYDHTLDVLPLAARQDANDGFVGSLWAPANLWAGTPFEVFVPVFPPASAQGGQPTLQLSINGQPSQAQAENVQGNYYKFRVPAQAEGIATLQVTASFGEGGDPLPENNAAFSTLQVFAAPRVLFVTGEPVTGQANAFVELLRQNNLQVDMLAPQNVPTDLKQLENYRVIFLHNLLSSQMGQEQMLSLQLFVSRQAGGLVFLGGRNSYTLGGYQGTPVEPMLPVKLEPPPRAERPPIAFTLVLDHSSSMDSGNLEGSAKPIDMAREAAMRAIETMQPEDYLGVLTFTDQFGWDVPLRQLGDGLALREALDAVSRVEANGGTKMYQAMQEALTGMMALPAGAPAARHILILSDGRSFDGSLDDFRALAQLAQQQNISVSTIAFGAAADPEVMSAIAEAGKGRFYAVTRAEELPRILIFESQAARSENVQAGETALKLGEPDHPVLSGMSPRQLPDLNGYNALSSKNEQGAEDILVSASFGDPILSAWQYGLGRVLVWTSDLGEEWAGAWPSTETQGKFWSQVVRYALVNPALGPAQVNVQVEDTRLVVDASLFDAQGEPFNLAQVTFSYADQAGQVRTFSLPQTGAGEYHIELPRPAEGAYRARIAYNDPDGNPVEVAAPFSVNPPAEWLPGDPNAGAANLAAWAKTAGGQVILANAILPQEGAAEAEPVDLPVPWWQQILLALVVFWPVEIAIRRRWLPWV